MLVMNAHTVTDMSGEGFAVRLFRQGNQGGFVRAISDQPQAFAAGFSKVLEQRTRRGLPSLSVKFACIVYLEQLLL